MISSFGGEDSLFFFALGVLAAESGDMIKERLRCILLGEKKTLDSLAARSKFYAKNLFFFLKSQNALSLCVP